MRRRKKLLVSLAPPFLKEHCVPASMMRSVRSFKTKISSRSFRLRDNRLKPPFGWRSPRSCSLSNVYRIAPPLMPYALASTGSTLREAYAEVVGADGWTPLTDLYASNSPLWLREAPAVE